MILRGQAMKKHGVVTLLIAVLIVIFYSPAFASEEVIVAGEPPITVHAVDCHIRLLEFVLQTRMTVAQKDTFLAAIKEECSQMEKQERQDFLEAVELVASMAEMDEQQLETVMKVLEKDFQESAASLPDDPAAQLFLKLQNESFKMVLEHGESGITRQALDAFAEYIAFVAKPEQPVWLDASATAAIENIIIQNFSNFNEEQKDSLEDFHQTWYMIRAAWQGNTKDKKKETWSKSLASVDIKPGETPDIKKIKAALSTDLYADLLDECTRMGVETLEWSTGTTFKVW